MPLTAEPQKESPQMNHFSSMIRKPGAWPVTLVAAVLLARPHVRAAAEAARG